MSTCNCQLFIYKYNIQCIWFAWVERIIYSFHRNWILEDDILGSANHGPSLTNSMMTNVELYNADDVS